MSLGLLAGFGKVFLVPLVDRRFPRGSTRLASRSLLEQVDMLFAGPPPNPRHSESMEMLLFNLHHLLVVLSGFYLPYY